VRERESIGRGVRGLCRLPGRVAGGMMQVRDLDTGAGNKRLELELAP
jgi:hypothetical protein